MPLVPWTEPKPLPLPRGSFFLGCRSKERFPRGKAPSPREGGIYLLEAILVVPLMAMLLWGAIRVTNLARVRLKMQGLAHLVSLLPMERGPGAYKDRLVSFLKLEDPGTTCSASGILGTTITCTLPNRGFKVTVKAVPFIQEVTVSDDTQRVTVQPVVKGYQLWPY